MVSGDKCPGMAPMKTISCDINMLLITFEPHTFLIAHTVLDDISGLMIAERRVSKIGLGLMCSTPLGR
jgi:hypothetical protein